MFSVLKKSWIFEAVDGHVHRKHIHHHVNFYWKALLLPMLTKATALFYEKFSPSFKGKQFSCKTCQHLIHIVALTNHIQLRLLQLFILVHKQAFSSASPVIQH